MKSKIYVLISVILLLISCKEDNKIEYYDLGTEIYISGEMTSLDNSVEISVDNPLMNLTETMYVTHLGIVDPDDEESTPASTDLGNFSLSSGAGSINLTNAQLGIADIGWTANIELTSQYNGKPFYRTYSISVDDPISTTDPGITHRNDTTFYFKFAIEPVSATVTNVSVTTKVSSAGSYSAVSGPFNAVDSIGFMGSNYNVGDTIFVIVSGAAGTKTAMTYTQLIISPVSVKTRTSLL